MTQSESMWLFTHSSLTCSFLSSNWSTAEETSKIQLCTHTEPFKDTVVQPRGTIQWVSNGTLISGVRVTCDKGL